LDKCRADRLTSHRPGQPLFASGMAVYTARAVLQGKGHDVWEMVKENV
jgi:hypothetical protein